MNLKQHLIRQMAWSHTNFGHGQRLGGLIDHIRKELVEVEDSNGSAHEWVDVVILALDGLTRELSFGNGDGCRADPEVVANCAISMIKQKQSVNEAREWDLSHASPDKAIEHLRGKHD